MTWHKQKKARLDQWLCGWMSVVLCGLLPLQLSAQQKPVPKPTAKNRAYFEAALDAAKWIQSTLVETPHGRLWPDDALGADKMTAELESGVAGTVLFLLALRHFNPGAVSLTEIRRGADYLLTALPADLKLDVFPPGTSLYYGVAGIGYVLHEVYRATGDKKYQAGARRCVELIQRAARLESDGASWTNFNDLLFGSASTGLFLLYAAREMNHAGARTLAIQTGRALLRRAKPEHHGLNWKLREDAGFVLPNFSHGTAGIGYFFATLYQETKQPEFLDAALAAAKYLKAIAKTEQGIFLLPYGWPNPAWEGYYDIGWAHGPAGAARFFYRLWQITKDPAWLAIVHGCARGIMESGLPGAPNAGFGKQPFTTNLRFGSAGAADFLVSLFQITGERRYLLFARQIADDILKKATRDQSGSRWVFPRGQFLPNPGAAAAFTGYFYGAAGYGWLLLHLDVAGRGQAWPLLLPDNPFAEPRTPPAKRQKQTR
jgi:lantibiotic modifying enzyme